MGVILVLGMLLIAVSSIYPAAHIIAEAATVLSGWFNKLVYGLQYLNFDALHRLTLTELQLVLVYIVIAGIAIFILKKNKATLFASGIALVLFIASSCFVNMRTLKQEMLIVYNISKDNRIELITGTTATILYGNDSVTAATQKFVLEPSHINMHIENVRKADKGYNMVQVAGKLVFILTQPISDTTIHADVVILNGKYADMREIKKVFQPEIIIILAKVPRNKAETIAAEATQVGLQVHDVNKDGAYILSK